VKKRERTGRRTEGKGTERMKKKTHMRTRMEKRERRREVEEQEEAIGRAKKVAYHVKDVGSEVVGDFRLEDLKEVGR